MPYTPWGEVRRSCHTAKHSAAPQATAGEDWWPGAVDIAKFPGPIRVPVGESLAP